MLKTPLLTLSLFILSSFHLKSQCLLVKLPLEQRIENATAIVEGRVVAKQSFWDEQQHNIFTANQVEVYKVLAGEVMTDHIEVLTRGGIVGLEAQIDHPSLQLEPYETGLFFLKDNQEKIPSANRSNLPVYQPSAGPQGFVKYNLTDGTASDPFMKYKDLTSELYRPVEDQTGHAYRTIKDFHLQAQTVAGSRSTLTSFNPTTVTGGTDALLTINGSGFGASQGNGQVHFSNADDGGASFIAALNSEIISWTDAEIQVQVPSRAGTGIIRVVDNGGGNHESATSLTVTYSHINLISDAISNGNHVSYNTQHRDDDGKGGYSFQYFTEFANSSGAPPFMRALETWCSGTNIHLTVWNNTSVDVHANDGVNVVRFDNGSELSSGTLAIGTSRFSGCFNGPNDLDWYVNEVDMVFNDDIDWNFGPGPTGGASYDFESAALHELGHIHQLAHIVNPNAVMHFGLANGNDQRILDAASDQAGGQHVYNRSTTSAVCSQPLMSTSVNCAALLLPAELLDFYGYADGKNNMLHWETASEINVREHVVERSENGVNGFERIGAVPGSTNSFSNIQYQLTDSAPLPFGYYRLTTHDMDGQFERHKIISIFRRDDQLKIGSPSPNPVSDNIFLPVSTPREVIIEYQLTSQIGQILQTGTLKIDQNIHQAEIEIQPLPKGIYLLNLWTGQEDFAFKLFKK